MLTEIKYSEKIASTGMLGPGNRAVIWVHGCCFDCKGCLAETYKTGPYKTSTAKDLADWFLSLDKCDGLTISGGEPMLQAEGILELIKTIRTKKDTGLIIYTGFSLEELQEKAQSDAGIRDLLNSIDILIDGRYVEELDDGVPYRGSSNQRIIQLTDRYSPVFASYYSETSEREVEIRILDRNTVMVGVPDREQLQLWENLKKLYRNNNE